MFAVRSIKQSFVPTPELESTMKTFRLMVNHRIRIGLEHNITTMRKLSSLSYGTLSEYDVYSKYKLMAISQAAGWSRFCHPRGLSDEAMRGNVDNLQPLILRVDGSKLQILK